jgi:branched-chain amino acid transport system ATP-binding protein/branched-chain amino acid transport system permease protein
VALAVAAWLLPYGLNFYAMQVVDGALVFAVLALGAGLAMGVAGQINLAQVAFFGVGAYALALLTTRAGLGFWPAALLAVLAAVAVGLLVGTPALRVQSHYLGIVTLGLAIAFLGWITNAAVAGGASGISAIPGPTVPGVDLTSSYLYYYLELLVFALVLAFGLFVVRTPLGRRLRAMRDDPLAAGALGAQIPLLRMTAFTLAAGYGGLAGVLYAGQIHYVSPDTFGIGRMFLLLAMIIIGGRQSLVGCVLGALVLSVLQAALADVAAQAQLAYGAVVVLAVVFAPTGLAGLPARFRARWHRKADRATLREFQPYPPAGSESTQEPLLDVKDLSMRFKGLLALDSVSLAVRAGEIRGVVGPNGSGKTTLFNVVSGLYRPAAGTVALAGRAVTGSRPWRLNLAGGVARTFQNLRLFADLTVRDNVLMAADRTVTRWSWRYLLWPPGVVRHERRLRRRADELLVRFGLVEFAAGTPRALPYGIQRRVEIARAVAAGPALLLLDEPAAGLRFAEKQQLSGLLSRLRGEGMSILLVEHDMDFVMTLADRLVVLDFGTRIAEGTPVEIAANPVVLEAYLGGVE